MLIQFPDDAQRESKCWWSFKPKNALEMQGSQSRQQPSKRVGITVCIAASVLVPLSINDLAKMAVLCSAGGAGDVGPVGGVDGAGHFGVDGVRNDDGVGDVDGVRDVDSGGVNEYGGARADKTFFEKFF